MNIVLTHEVEAKERSALELEAHLGQEHQLAMLTFDVQDMVTELVQLYRTMMQHVESYQASGNFSDEHTQELYALFVRMSDLFSRAAKMVAHIESRGHVIHGTRDFAYAARELRGIASVSYDSVIRGARQIALGETKTLEEVTRELWEKNASGI